MTIVKKIVAFIAVVCLVFSASSATAFADSTPTPDVTPYPWYTTPPLQPIHVEGAFSVYYMKYASSVSWTDSIVLNSDGSTSSLSGRVTTDFISISPTLDKMICLRNVLTNKWYVLNCIAFYDSSYSYISGSGVFNSVSLRSFSDIPSNASFFRITSLGTAGSSYFNNYLRVLRSPEFVSFDNSTLDFVDNFWRDYIYSYAYTVSDSKTYLSLYSAHAVDELFLDFKFSDSFIPCDVVSCTLLTEVKDGGYNNSFYPVEYNARDDHTQVSYALFNPYFYDSDGVKIFCSRNASTQRNNPFSPSVRTDEGMFSGFTFIVPLIKPDGLRLQSQVNITLSDFTINYNDVVVDSIDSLSEMDRISSELQLPTPDTGVIFDNLNITVQQMQNTDFYNVDWFGPTGGILMTMLVTVFTFAALGYILFGKKG